MKDNFFSRALKRVMMFPKNLSVGVDKGIGWLLLCHLLAEALLLTVGVSMSPIMIGSYPSDELLLAAMLCIGITQLIYAIPLCLWCASRRRFETMKGVLIGMLITAFLNGTCFLGVVLTG